MRVHVFLALAFMAQVPGIVTPNRSGKSKRTHSKTSCTVQSQQSHTITLIISSYYIQEQIQNSILGISSQTVPYMLKIQLLYYCVWLMKKLMLKFQDVHQKNLWNSLFLIHSVIIKHFIKIKNAYILKIIMESWVGQLITRFTPPNAHNQCINQRDAGVVISVKLKRVIR